jgi:integrase
VFCTRSGKALGQRNVLRALRLAQTKARTRDGKPVFPELQNGAKVVRNTVPHFHALRHSAASEAIAAGDSVEEVSWQLGHRDSTVTRQVYVHEIASAERRARRRASMEARYGAMLEAPAEPPKDVAEGEVVELHEARKQEAG